jgi:hypothetical protein
MCSNTAYCMHKAASARSAMQAIPPCRLTWRQAVLRLPGHAKHCLLHAHSSKHTIIHASNLHAAGLTWQSSGFQAMPNTVLLCPQQSLPSPPDSRSSGVRCWSSYTPTTMSVPAVAKSCIVQHVQEQQGVCQQAGEAQQTACRAEQCAVHLLLVVLNFCTYSLYVR